MNIALVAMSGIRVCDPELMRLGLTLPGFVERGKQIASLPSLGLLTLAALTPARHRIHYFEVADFERWQGAGSMPTDFDLVAISSLSAQIDEAYQLADFYRHHRIPVVLGGLHATCVPQEALGHADAVVTGEGETNWEAVLEDAESRRLKPVYRTNGMEFDLARAPLPAFELLDIDQYNRLTVQTSRGCPHLCDFCASSVLLTKKYKQKPIARVLAEIDKICSLWKHPFIEFADDNSLVHKTYWKELLPELAKRHFKWFAETDLSVAQDTELLRLMRESGCAQVLIGLESPAQDALLGIEVKRNWKWGKWAEYRDAILTIQSHGISVNGCFITGLDGHGPGIFDDIFEFVEQSGLHEVQITIQTAFPGTLLYERLRNEGRLLEATNWRKCTLFDVNFKPRGMTAGELTSGFRNLVVKLYSDESTRRRQRRFRQSLRAHRHSA